MRREINRLVTPACWFHHLRVKAQPSGRHWRIEMTLGGDGGLVNFVEQMAAVSGGVAAYCNADDLGNMVIDSFTNGRRKRRTIG